MAQDDGASDASISSLGDDSGRPQTQQQQEGLGSCRLCMKMRLRIENEERARVKAQEQLAKLHAENIRLRGGRTSGGGSSSSRLGTSSSELPEEAAQDALGSIDLDNVGRTLESYRREVSLLRAAVREKEEQESRFEQRQRALRAEHEQAQLEWESQVAGLICEVQDLEARNMQLQRTFRLATEVSGSTSTAASGSGTRPTSSEAANLSSPEDPLLPATDA